MPKHSPIADSYSRCRILAAIVEGAKSAAQSDPTNPKWRAYGIVADEDTKKEAAQKIDRAFDDLIEMIAHISILDMAATFERASRARVGSRIGEARKAHKAAARQLSFPSYSIGFLRGTEEFGSFNAMISLMDGHIGEDLSIKLKAIRNARNNYAHGTDLRALPAISGQDTLDCLNETLDLL